MLQLGPGTIPSLADLTSLLVFECDQNPLLTGGPAGPPVQMIAAYTACQHALPAAGSLPASWLPSASLRVFDVSYCGLSGSIPPVPIATSYFGGQREWCPGCLSLRACGFAGLLPNTTKTAKLADYALCGRIAKLACVCSGRRHHQPFQ